MTVFDETLIDDIIRENFVNKNSNYKYDKAEGHFVLTVKDTPNELKTFSIHLS